MTRTVDPVPVRNAIAEAARLIAKDVENATYGASIVEVATALRTRIPESSSFIEVRTSRVATGVYDTLHQGVVSLAAHTAEGREHTGARAMYIAINKAVTMLLSFVEARRAGFPIRNAAISSGLDGAAIGFAAHAPAQIRMEWS